jgi:hypothetical protein
VLALWLAQRPEHHAKAALDIAFGYVVATILFGPANLMDFIGALPRLVVWLPGLGR